MVTHCRMGGGGGVGGVGGVETDSYTLTRNR